MPTVTITPSRGYAHCRDPRCAGNEQEAVDVVVNASAFSYREMGGDMPGTERSTEHVAFADEEADGPCPVCSLMREATTQKRPVITNVSGYDQRGLLNSKGFDASRQGGGGADGAALAAVLEQNGQLMRELAEMRQTTQRMNEVLGPNTPEPVAKPRGRPPAAPKLVPPAVEGGE